MRTLKASFLLIGPWEPRLQEWGAHIATDLQQARNWLQDSIYDVVAVSVTVVLGKSFAAFHEEVKKSSPAAQFIVVVPNDFSAHQLARLHEDYSFFRVLSSYQDPLLENHLFAALEEANQQKQDEHLEFLIREQTDQLKKLQLELEERVQKRTKYLSEARRKLFHTNSRIEGFRRALMAVHLASTIGEIEQFLQEAMAATVQTSWIRLLYHPQDEIFLSQSQGHLDFTNLQVPLFSREVSSSFGDQRMGSIFFLRPPKHPYTHDEKEFLRKVADTVALALDRIQKLRELEVKKDEWEATFNSMSDPVLLIDKNFEVIQSNKALEERLEGDEKKLLDRKCYKLLFNREEPCVGCRRGQNFRVQGANSGTSTFEVYSQSLSVDSGEESIFVNLYHDITQQLKMERQILESAKLAELGTIGSSIAHELNNPLGGILSFTQLIKMEMNPEDGHYPDILEMEAGVKRCKDIVENLLGFTRNPAADLEGDVNLVEACSRALKVVELQTKSQGIEVRMKLPEKEVFVRGHLNLLAQGLKNVLQNALEQLSEKIQHQKGFQGVLDLEISAGAELAQVLVKHNAAPERNTSIPLGLTLSVAHQILADHHAQLELQVGPGQETLAKISFSRLVLRS